MSVLGLDKRTQGLASGGLRSKSSEGMLTETSSEVTGCSTQRTKAISAGGVNGLNGEHDHCRGSLMNDERRSEIINAARSYERTLALKSRLLHDAGQFKRDGLEPEAAKAIREGAERSCPKT